jgi:hypothetical protein
MSAPRTLNLERFRHSLCVRGSILSGPERRRREGEKAREADLKAGRAGVVTELRREIPCLVR